MKFIKDSLEASPDHHSTFVYTILQGLFSVDLSTNLSTNLSIDLLLAFNVRVLDGQAPNVKVVANRHNHGILKLISTGVCLHPQTKKKSRYSRQNWNTRQSQYQAP